MKLAALQVSQLFINAQKLARIEERRASGDVETSRPVPVKRLGDAVVLTDGHTRALAAHLAGEEEIAVYWDTDDEDWEAYEICVRWCVEAGIRTIQDLADRILAPAEYEVRWLGRCREMQTRLKAARRGE